MSNFVDRLEYQRKIIKIINSSKKFTYDINGLSKPSIYTWALKNRISREDEVYILVLEISDLLSLLANHSQESVSEQANSFNSNDEILDKLSNNLSKLKDI